MKNQTPLAFLAVLLFALLITSLVFTAQGFSTFETAHLHENLEADESKTDQTCSIGRILTYEENVKRCPEFKTFEFKNLHNDRETNTVSASILKISPACQKTSNDSTSQSIKKVAANKSLNIVLENYKFRKIYADGALDGDPTAYEFTVESFKTTIESKSRSFQQPDPLTSRVSDELSARRTPERQGWNFFHRFRKVGSTI